MLNMPQLRLAYAARLCGVRMLVHSRQAVRQTTYTRWRDTVSD